MRMFGQKQQQPKAATSLIGKPAQSNAQIRVEGLVTGGTAPFSHCFSSIPVHAARLASDQPPVTTTSPGDIYEQEAEHVASQVMRAPDMAGPKSNVPATRDGADATAPNVPKPIQEVLQQPGVALDAGDREFMESRFGYDFSRVRVHTGEAAANTARALHAQAYTVGHNVVFAPGRYTPHDWTGQRLLAHELAHVVQQTIASTPGATHGSPAPGIHRASLRPSPQIISRWVDLGYTSWTGDFGTVVIHHRVGTESEWREVLKDADNEDTYRTYLQGFLELATDPSSVGATGHHGYPNYVNKITRAPSKEEILQFMRALYSLAGELDMTPSIFADTFLNDIMKSQISKLVSEYQNDWITEISESSPAKGVAVDKHGVRAVASQGGSWVSNAMINSAIHTSQEGVAKLIVAQAKNSEADRDEAFSIVLNAAKVIRASLDAQEAQLAEARKMDSLLLKVIFDDLIPLGKIPYVSMLVSLLPTITNHLKATAFEMAVSAMATDNPTEQADRIGWQFANHVKQLGPNGLKVLDDTVVNLTIAMFEAGTSKK